MTIYLIDDIYTNIIALVSGRPIAPSGLKIVSYSHDTVSLSWTVPDTDTPILSFRIEKKEVRNFAIMSYRILSVGISAVFFSRLNCLNVSTFLLSGFQLIQLLVANL